MDLSSEIIHALLPLFLTTILGVSVAMVGLIDGITISSAGVSAQYMEFVTRDAALMLLNRSPEGLDYWMEQILELADPAANGKLKADLVRIVEEQRGSAEHA